ncbi:hypothetical protein BYT27DRAFT_7215784 [Phlegmacium glaucopus]|nr:hypothetical protein BYT27DRAFT_7215784 [Phlegmacium glaucopus]
MASPLADPIAVQKIVDDLNGLATNSVDIEEGVDKANQQAVEVAKKYQSDFDILSKIPAFFEEFSDNLRKDNNAARDVATKISAEFGDFVLILEAVVEPIVTKEQLQEAVEALQDILEIENPLDATPLDGFQGVTNEFNNIWTLKVDETNHIIDVLGKATDIKKTIKKLTTELKPVKEGCASVQQALNDYAGHIHN